MTIGIYNIAIIEKTVNDAMFEYQQKAIKKLIELGYADTEQDAILLYDFNFERFEAENEIDAFEEYLYFMDYLDYSHIELSELKKEYERKGGCIIKIDDWDYLVMISVI